MPAKGHEEQGMQFFLIREDFKIHSLMKKALCCARLEQNKRELPALLSVWQAGRGDEKGV